MILMILTVQVALPLVLIAWVALLPAVRVVGFATQAAGTGAFLFALARVAQWAVPVWWLPWVFGALWLVAVMAWLARKGFAGASLLPDAPLEWLGLTLSVVLLGLGGRYSGAASVRGSMDASETFMPPPAASTACIGRT